MCDLGSILLLPNEKVAGGRVYRAEALESNDLGRNSSFAITTGDVLDKLKS